MTYSSYLFFKKTDIENCICEIADRADNFKTYTFDALLSNNLIKYIESYDRYRMYTNENNIYYIKFILPAGYCYKHTELAYQYFYSDNECTTQLNTLEHINYIQTNSTGKNKDSIYLFQPWNNLKGKYLFIKPNEIISTLIKCKITQNLTNCSSDFTLESVEENTEITITLTANTGYLFNSSPQSNLGSFIVADDKKTATLTTTVTQDLTITATAEEKQIEYVNVIYNLTECICNISDTEVIKDEPIYISVESDRDFTTIPYILMNGEQIEFNQVITTSKKSYHKTFTPTHDFEIFADATQLIYYTITQNLNNCRSDLTDIQLVENSQIDITLTTVNNSYFNDEPQSNLGSFIVADDKKTATLNTVLTNDLIINANATKYYTITQNLTNCSSDFTLESVEENTEITITLTANTGYLFNSSPQSNLGSFIVADDKKTATLNTVLTNDLIINANASEKIEVTSNFINLYSVNENILNELSKVEFIDVDVSGVTRLDYTQNITGLYKIPFNTDNIKTSDNYNIMLGKYNSLVKAPKINTDVLTVDLGQITIPKINKNCSCILYCPYVQPIKLNPDYINNQTITIKYKINLYDGQTTILIYSTLSNSLIATEEQKIKKDLPFIQRNNNTPINNISTFIDNEIKTAYIEILDNDLNINCGATKEEQEQLKQLLLNGVFEND